jgi:(1->4)-alpha-D-glucan 1-alpha-D-glucosylmutase
MDSRHLPISSYRLQFAAGFGFADAHRVLPYLEALGITDCYASPLLKSAAGSQGYGTSDHDALNRDLGSDQEFDDFSAALTRRSMGLILDFVPNHMGLDASNRWWHDVLQHGQGSPYADYFDIDWDPVTPELKGRVLLPILQDGYGDVLHRGELRLTYEGGDFLIRYGDRRLPVEPLSSLAILRHRARGAPAGSPSASAERAAGESPDWRDYLDIVGMIDRMPPPSRDGDVQARRQDITRMVRQRLVVLVERSPVVRTFIEGALACFNGTPGQPATFDRLHELLDRQPYRLAHWKTAFDEINYRRFFDVNDLGALRMEDPRVFNATHRLVLQLIALRKVTGLRIDHADGLLDPAEYLGRLDCATARLFDDGGEGPREPFYVVVEKILGYGEFLPEGWRIAGTTGYGFLNAVNGLFVDPANEESFRRLYARTTGRRDSFSHVAYHSKRLVMASSMASELAVLARGLKTIAGSDRRTRDFTLTVLRKAIVEVVACLPVYRTYVNASGFSAADRATIDLAVDRARQINPVLPESVFLFLRKVLLAKGEEPDEESHRHFAMKFQQFSVPVHAKGVEDTSFYRYNALLSLNEVGGDPGRFGTSVEEFHAGNRVRLERWPRELLATATHDTKRGEDARARLDVLSEMPASWQRAVSGWRKINAAHRTAVDRQSAPDANVEYLFYQTLVGSWPAEPIDAPISTEAPPDLVARLRLYMQKAMREAKTHTSWVNQNNAYEDAVSRFVETTLQGSAAQGFLTAFIPFMRRVALGGMVNSLAQLVLKIASPGVPDFYQGTEAWHLDMADPDNRRPVDLAGREASLGELMPWIARAESDGARSSAGCSCRDDDELEQRVGELLATWPDSRIKMFVTACGLRLRRRESALFIKGDYEALRGEGHLAPHVVAFARLHEKKAVVAAVPRLMSRGAPHGLPTGSDVWKDTRLFLPASASTATVRHLFTGARLRPDAAGGYLLAADVFRTCPVALLIADEAREI